MKETYTYDWFTANASSWPSMLEPFRGREGLKFLEVGSFEGRSACWLLRNILTSDSSTLTCIDIFPEELGGDELAPRKAFPNARFDANIAATGVAHKVSKLRGRSEEMLRQLPPLTYDFIYIDGSHEAPDVLIDAVLSWYCLKEGGIICFDDYLWAPDFPEVARPKLAIDAFMAVFAGHFELLFSDYQVALKKLSAA